ncbi:MAG: hypothetical protein M1828_005074 [Chrysothrix sp. TS-e1954]|nr:MAG: hypothetical protein M1828_005074 [Chrysothrix sp. TS-e1954]
MSGLDVEELLESTANARPTTKDGSRDDREGRSHREDHHDDRRRREDSRDRHRDRHHRYRERSPDRSRRDRFMDEGMRASGGYDRRRYRSRSRDYRKDERDGRNRMPEKDPDTYRPGGTRSERDGRGFDRDGTREQKGRSDRGPRHKSPTPEPRLTEDERDKRTVFVQQLSQRLRTKQLIAFFEQAGPVKEAQIVKDRVSGRSKGVGYVEFKEEESVSKAIGMTGQKLCDLPVIAQLTEAEKNRQARNADSTSGSHSSMIPFHRLYVGNIHFSITEQDLQNVFEPFGELEFAQLQMEEGGGRSRGYGFVQFKEPAEAKEALEKMNGFELAGRAIRVGLGNDKFTPETTAGLMHRFQGRKADDQGSSFSGFGGRGAQAGGSGGSYDRTGRDTDKASGAASALDDADVGGVNFNNYSRDSLMRKLARTDDSSAEAARERQQEALKKAQARQAAAVSSSANNPSRCIRVRNCFDPNEEQGTIWAKELEDDIKNECDEKYGQVVHIRLDPNTEGDVYVKFDRVQGGQNAILGLNGRFFGGRTLTAQFMVDPVYKTLFPESADS